MFTPGVYPEYPNVRNPLGIEAWSGVFAFLDALTDVVFFLLIVLTAAALFDRLRRADADERLQIRWFVFAGSIVILGFLVDLMRGAIPELQAASVVLTVVAVTVMPVAVGIAILRYRLYDIDVVIKRTVV